MNVKAIGLLALMWSSVACTQDPSPRASPRDRWYTPEQMEQGRAVFLAHCASCHGERAEGTPDWREPGADGNYPPPPLNGTAHAWHHSLAVLDEVIDKGGVPFGGVMPPFARILTREERLAAIAYFQSFWPDEIYARWREIDQR